MAKYSYKKSYAGWWITGGITVLVAGLFWLGNHSASKQTNRQLALSCTTDMFTQFHIHPYLQILINGQQQNIPANIGISLTCMNPIHTHDASGILHVESPEPRDFTLADFFAVWGKDIRSFGANMRMTVNGAENTEYENYVMRDKDKIELRFD